MPISNRRPLYSDENQPATAAAVAAPAIVDAPDPAQGPSSSVVRAINQASDTSFRQPCTLKGVASAAYAGALGYFLGFVPAGIKFKGRQWGMVHAQGVASASQLAIMSGMYTAVHCICQRIRMVEDGWNRGIAGCSTGLVLGWKAGPWSALQSCAGIGLLSALIDFGGGAVDAAEASMLCHLQQLQHEQSSLHAAAGADNPLQQLAALLARPCQQQETHSQLAARQPSNSSTECSGTAAGVSNATTGFLERLLQRGTSATGAASSCGECWLKRGRC
ncbi:hypothetical protein COO60DRAFT_187159 [Scenedesmus sp. NREL 46B-D3]|nr:hypothetical protein COO60DRAFT_187159 [Scenedesmus sp. NREL 46B-D3]